MQDVKELMQEVGIDTVIQQDGVTPIIAGCASITRLYANNEVCCDNQKEECTA